VPSAISVYLHLPVIKSCLIWTSLCMLFMTDRQQRFDQKNVKIDNAVETKTPTSWIPLR